MFEIEKKKADQMKKERADLRQLADDLNKEGYETHVAFETFDKPEEEEQEGFALVRAAVTVSLTPSDSNRIATSVTQ